jgi:hypothetical protein
MDQGFAPNVFFHPPKPADERAKKLWELWSKVAEADKEHQRALKCAREAESELKESARARERTGNRLRDAMRALESELAVPPAAQEPGT